MAKTITNILADADAAVVTRQPESIDLGALFEGDRADLRTFSSGKTGYGYYGKVKLPGGRRAQVSLNVVILKD